MPEASEIVAALGPTNTGKTHRAIQRLREHESGMIGLPLRLLAREVYDRISEAEGESSVALITGEERRVPARPRYWVCTVEAMPPGREVDFLAVDEIQLAGHPERGHVFTDRLLHARGRKETWFLGAETMEPLIRRLVPTAQFRRFPRLSSLRSEGTYTLGALPPRTAVVAFSAARVYELAERIKARRGGAAIVLGALSPRARNAQVAMYQAGEVDYLVATDAIGMGLNLDVDRVVFADTRKFDGREARPLDAAELAQIAGRAGRYQNDGAFGTLAPRERLPAPLEAAIEDHRFPPQKSLVWRNSDLDFTSPLALLAALGRSSCHGALRLVHHPEDTVTLTKLVRRPEVLRRATTPERVRLLWDVCQIPDYRQLLLDHHATLAEEIFVRLADEGTLASQWLEPRIERLTRHPGDIESITSRIAFVRTWTYVACRDAWVGDPERWRQRTRRIEDELSDALHRALVERFVERRKRSPAPSARHRDAGTARKVPDSPFGELAALKAKLEGTEAPDSVSVLERIPEAPHSAFCISGGVHIGFEGTTVARLTPGRTLLEPEVRLVLPEEGTGLERRILRRMRAFAKDFVAETLGPLASIDERALSPSARGLVYQLKNGLGTVPRAEVRELLDSLLPEDERALDRTGLVVGSRYVFAKPLLRKAAIERRAALIQAFSGNAPLRAGAARVSWSSPADSERRYSLALGFPVVGTRAIRCDVVERIVAELHDAKSVDETQKRIAAWCGCGPKEARHVARALGRESPPKRRRSRGRRGSARRKPHPEAPPPSAERGSSD